MKKREDLRIVISSATLDAEVCKTKEYLLPSLIFTYLQLYKNFFETNSLHGPPSKDTAAIMSIEGRAYPVDIYYTTQPVPSYLMGVVETVLTLHREQGTGDILAFLTGQDEVERAVAEIKCV